MKAQARIAALIFAALGGLAPAVPAQSTTRTLIHEEDPADAASRETIAKAEAAMDRKDFAGAVQICTDYLDNYPDNAAVHFQLGYAYSALGKPDDAEDEYRNAIEIDPKMGPAYLNLGLTLLDSNPEAALSALQQASELMPDQPRPKYALGMALEHAGKDDAAIEQFHEALKLDGRNFPAQLELARILLHSKKYPEAENEFHKAVEIQPNASAAHLGLAQTLIAENKTADAATELERYLQTNPKDVDARIERASILTDLGRNEEALAELDRASALRPEIAATLKLRSLIQFRLKNYDAALATLKRIEATTPNDPDVHAKIGHLLLEKKDYADATNELAMAFHADPTQTEVLRDLLAAEYLGGNYPATLEGLDLLAKRETLSNGSWFIRASCYDKLGKIQEALDAYRKFLELNAGQTNDQYFLAASRVRTLERELKDKKK
ncbi:MAG: tetratricopeptide repeat protein [Candidatus Acidiferrales bacterium]|jgi:tetratricopeptide (TPR) repeat protein